MVNTIRCRSNSSSSRTPLPSLSQGGASIPQGSLSPSQPDVTTPQPPSSGTDSNTHKSVRGIALRKLNKKNNNKLTIHIDPIQRRPTDSVESAKLSSELGQLSRESLPVPIKWKNVKKTELMRAFDQLDKFPSVEEAIQNKPSYGGLTQENWEMERCNINKQNRLKMMTNHNQGSRSFVAAHRMLSHEQEFDGDEVDRISFHKHTHYTEGKGWITPQSENNHVEMENRKIDAETRGEIVDVDKIADDVLGKRKSMVTKQNPVDERWMSAASIGQKNTEFEGCTTEEWKKGGDDSLIIEEW
ncbi:hypothetical protein BUALT_Bualt07G0108900 [Buddleja alternifolia]|uniref:Uncharacterized protein n=1 Tax=Buddleja alternifolia TaxID=168488 RepID=A0AAV6XKF0_9LAMI|nr:hypothetical protein BUALT_Bualt07G0108900 [Buddleja alternifolia]